MSDFILSPAASRDLDEIWEYIAEDNLDAADRWVDKLKRPCTSWLRCPRSGTPARI